MREEYARMETQVTVPGSARNRPRNSCGSKDGSIRSLEESIEAAKASSSSPSTRKASLTARQQRYETMLEQVNLRRSEVSQKLLK